jgi:hypothetical protein
MAFWDFGALIGKLNGIKFPAVQVPSADANTLDDYEEGTFTPTISFGGASVGVTYDSANCLGTYVKIGKLVRVQVQLSLASKGSSTGNALIGGLPFSPSSSESYASFVFGFANSMASITGHPMALGVKGSPSIELLQFVSNSSADLTNANFTNTSNVMISGMYTA